MSPRAELPGSARCVIIGGGVGGASIAYHLAKLGYRDVVLLDRAELTSGSTFHSAGLVGQLRGSVSLTKMMMHSVDVYRGLAAESELDPGWVECGGIRLASSEERMEELRRQAGWAKTFGLPLELISAEEAKQMFPLMSHRGRPRRCLAADRRLHRPLAAHLRARRRRPPRGRPAGVPEHPGDRDRGRERRVRAVETEKGRIEAEVVVNAGGMFAAEIGRIAGVRVPVVPFGHQYLVTQPVREHSAERRLPTLRDPDLLVYFREDGGGLVMGGYERDSQPAFLPDGPGGFDAIPPDFNGRLLEDDWDRFAEITENSKVRVPVMDEAKITKLINGPEAFTPDNEFCLGESEVRGFFVAAGFCAHGLAGAGGIGRVIAEWIAEGEPSLDLWEMDVRRFGSQYRSPAYTHARTRETYETYYDIRYPNHERSAGRPLRLSAANAWHRRPRCGVRREVGLGAGQLVRVERRRRRRVAAPARLGRPALVARDRRRAPGHPRGGGAVRRELVREAGDRRPRRGRPARAPLRQPGRARAGKITYTQMLNARGGIECDFTVARLADELFQIVTGRRSVTTIASGSASTCPEDGRAQVRDVTSAWSCFGIWGPRAREVLAPLTPADLSNEAFPYMSRARDHRRQRAGPGAAGHLRRRARLGALLPDRVRAGLWRALWEAGEPHGLVAGGYRAIDSLRLEKGYRVWGADITPDETPYEGGVGFCVKLDKEGGFIGREALVEAKEAGPRTRLCCLVLADPRSVALGNEPVRIGGEIAGRVTTGGYGYTVERSIAYAYLPPEHAEAGTPVEVEIFGEWVAGEVATEPLFDPKGERIRA